MNRKNIEKKLNNISYNDGLFDIACGIYFIAIGLSNIMNQLVKMAILFGVIAAYNYLKRKLIDPRVGHFKFSVKRNRMFRRQNIIVASITIFFLIVIIFSKIGLIAFNIESIHIISSVIILAIVIILARSLNFDRLYLYGSIVLFATLFMNYLVATIGEKYALLIVFILPGTLILFYGLIKLLLFLKNNKKIDGDDDE